MKKIILVVLFVVLLVVLYNSYCVNKSSKVLISEPSPLLDAVRSNDIESMKSLLANGANPNIRDDNKNTLLMELSYNPGYKKLNLKKLYKCTELLIKHGVDVNAENRFKDTALIEFSYFDSPELIQLLIDNGARVNAKNYDLVTPLHKALNSGNYSTAKTLIDLGAYIKAKTIDGVTPLHYACDGETFKHEVYTFEDQYKIAKELIDDGADVNATTVGGLTPIVNAISSGNVKLVELLINSGADVNPGESGLLYIRSEACFFNKRIIPVEDQIKMADLLIENGAMISKSIYRKLLENSWNNMGMHSDAIEHLKKKYPYFVSYQRK